MNETNNLLLIVPDDKTDSSGVVTFFRNQADTHNLAWTARSVVLDAVDENDLKNADLIVELRRAGEADRLHTKFPLLDSEVWEYQQESELLDCIEVEIKKLVVRLIMKGGRRPPIASPPAAPPPALPAGGKTSIRVQLESKGRGGKKVTTITGLPLDEASMQQLATALKQACGTGGTVKDDHIEIQGDQCNRVIAELAKRGYKAKRSGG